VLFYIEFINKSKAHAIVKTSGARFADLF